MQFESFWKIHQDVYKIVFKISFLQHSRWEEWGLGYSKQEETSFILASDLKLSEKIYWQTGNPVTPIEKIVYIYCAQ